MLHRSHNYGTPRTFNQAGVEFYTRLFQGVAGERGVANNDPVPEIIPAGPNYAHTGTGKSALIGCIIKARITDTFRTKYSTITAIAQSRI